MAGNLTWNEGPRSSDSFDHGRDTLVQVLESTLRFFSELQPFDHCSLQEHLLALKETESAQVLEDD